MKRHLLACSAVLVCAAGAALYPSSNSEAVARPAAEAAMYSLDTVHSGVLFRIKHMSVSNFVGRFNAFDGSFNIDWDNPQSSSLEIVVDASSVDSNNAKRDDHLRSNDFFNVKQFPNISFVGKTFVKESDDRMVITGDLTYLGVTNEVAVQTSLVGVGDTRQGYKMGIDSTFTIKRTDFNDSKYIDAGALGDEVTLWINLVGVRGDG